MKVNTQYLITCILLISSCAKDENNNPVQVPVIYTFDHSVISAERAFVILENDTFTEIDTKSGSLYALRSFANSDMYQYVRNTRFGYYIQSFELVEPDSVRLHIWASGLIEYMTRKADIDNVHGVIMEEKSFGSDVILDKNKGEIKFCMAFLVEIENSSAPNVSSYGLLQCNSLGIQNHLNGIIDAKHYEKNDTIGLYLMDMIYKR